MRIKNIVSAGKSVGLVSLCLLGCMILLVTSDIYTDMVYISTRLNISYHGDANELDRAFKRMFVPGMTIDEVNQTLIDIDPTVQTIDKGELECNSLKCCELVHLFERRVQDSWGYTFCFDNASRLLFVTLFPG